MRRLSITCIAVLILVVFTAMVSSVTSPMPYRPGYGLGSWLPPGLLDGMKKEAYSRSAILLSEQMESAATSLEMETRMAASPLRNPLASGVQEVSGVAGGAFSQYQQRAQAFRDKAWELKMDAYSTLFDQLEQQSKLLRDAAKSGKAPMTAFSTFASSVESPVEWDTSNIDYVDRGADSINLGSIFLDHDDVRELTASFTSDKSHNETRSAAINRLGAQMNRQEDESLYKQTTAALARAYSVYAVDSTLILTSFATHRLVKQFKKLNTNPMKLREAWNYLKPDKPIPHPEYQTPEFADAFADATRDVKKDLDDSIAMVSEIYQGSAFVGFVHFLKVDDMSSSSETRSLNTQTMAARFKLSNFVDKHSHSTTNTKKLASSLAEMTSASASEVRFDIIVQGYIPSIKSKELEQTVYQIIKHADPATKASSADGAQGSMEKQSNTESVVTTLIDSMNAVSLKNPVLGMQSFMDALEDYTTEAKKVDTRMGAPVGMNVKQWSRIDVLSELAEYWFGPGTATMVSSSGSSTSGSSSTSGGAASSASVSGSASASAGTASE